MDNTGKWQIYLLLLTPKWSKTFGFRGGFAPWPDASTRARGSASRPPLKARAAALTMPPLPTICAPPAVATWRRRCTIRRYYDGEAWRGGGRHHPQGVAAPLSDYPVSNIHYARSWFGDHVAWNAWWIWVLHLNAGPCKVLHASLAATLRCDAVSISHYGMSQKVRPKRERRISLKRIISQTSLFRRHTGDHAFGNVERDVMAV